MASPRFTFQLAVPKARASDLAIAFLNDQLVMACREGLRMAV